MKNMKVKEDCSADRDGRIDGYLTVFKEKWIKSSPGGSGLGFCFGFILVFEAQHPRWRSARLQQALQVQHFVFF